MKSMKRILAILTVLAMVVTSVPNAFWTTAHAATDSGSTGTQIADDTTLDNWKMYFGNDDNNFNTQYAGHVWTDKSVTTDASKFDYATELADSNNKIAMNDDQNNFLVSLSAMASSKSITGQDNKPTDTMIVLDMSSSMYVSSSERDPGPVTEMIKSVNSTIKQLQELNVNNRVGVTIYYGGPDLNQATKDSYQVWLPLDRYKHKDNKFLVAETSGGKLSSAGVNSNVTTESGTAVKANTRATTETAGTYMQQGILSALNEFMDADTKVPDNAAVNAGETRTPVMVLMSDGKPTAATNQYTRLDSAAIMGSNRENIRSANETDFLTQLTASYAKEMMDAHYKEETPLFYTLSFGNGFSYTVMDPSGTLEKKNTEHESSPATVSGYWNKLIANNSITLSYKVSKGQWNAETTSKSCTVSRTTVDGKTFPSSASQQYYVNKAFEAASSDDLADAFANIFTDISLQTHTYPTLVEGDENLDGYISFVDKIGEYMNVTDVKGVLLGEHWYSGKEFAKKLSELGDVSNPTPLGDELVWSIQQRLGLPDSVTVRTLLNLAYQHGQLAYGNDGSYSNYVGWYSDAQGNYLGFWQEGVTTAPGNATHTNKSYVYLGETDDSHGVADSDMMYTTVRVRHEIKTGIESVSFAVPAALIPTVEYDVEYDENDNLKSVTKGGAQHPIRLVYEVALDDSVSEYTINDAVDSDYIAHNTDTAGYVNFYTNQYEGDGSVGYGKVNTYSYFKPSHQNENYYYQENEPVYINKTGTVYKGENGPDSNGVFYREITVYSNNNGTIKAENIYRQLSSAALQTAVPKADGTWYIPKGNVHVNMDGYTITKDENKTETLENANLPYVDVNGHSVNDTNHRFVIGDTLGNNGKVRIKPATGIKLSKAVTGVDSNVDLTKETFEFTVTADANVNGSCDAVKVAADGTETETTVAFSNGKAEVSLKHGESLYIMGLAAGIKFTVTEAEEADFVVSEVKVDGTVIPVTIASGTLDNGQIADVEFTNVPRGKGMLTIAKQVEHPLGTDYQIPADKIFSINVKLEGIAVSSGDEFEVTHTGDADLKKVKVGSDKSFTLTLKHGELVEIKGIPEGTKATVTESNPGPGFTVTYKENGVNGDGVIESIKKAPTVDNVTVVNAYAPEPAKVKIDLNGTKILKDKDGKTIPKEQWGDLQFKFIIQKYVYEQGEWRWINTETVDTANSTNDKVDFLTDGRELTFNEVGTYGYQVIEENHGLTVDGITYDAEMHTFNVIVTDTNMDGKLEARVESSHGDTNNFVLTDGTWTNDQINFTNTNNQGHVSRLIMIKKAVENESGSSNVSLAGYKFGLYETDSSYNETGNLVKTTEATDAAGETYVQLEYDYNQTGTYYYKLKEIPSGINGMIDSNAVYNIKVVVTNDDEGNVYAEITSENENQFGSFVGAGSGYEYKLASFTNVYDPKDITVNLDVHKTLANKKLNDDEYTFQLKQGDNVLQTVKNKADGRVDFDALTFSKVGTYSYEVSEVIPADNEKLPGVTYDETVYDVIVTVTDVNGELKAAVDVLTVAGTTMVFENEYTPGPVKVKLEGEKELKGKDLEGGMFTFAIAESDKDGNIIPNGFSQRVANNDGGKFEFNELTYSAAGTHYFVISEEIPQTTRGITYDSSKYLATVEIGYDEVAGEYTVDKTYKKIGGSAADAIKFVNDYEAAPTSEVIHGIKDLEGRTLEADQFEFKLYSADDKWNKGTDALQTKTNDKDGYFKFNLDFTKAGTYYYIVDETDGNAPGYTYDDKYVGVIIKVTDDMSGNLHAVTRYVDLEPTTGGGFTETQTAVVIFENTYGAEPAAVSLTADKKLTGREWNENDKFQFKLTAEDKTAQEVNAGNVVIDSDTATVDKNNKTVKFTGITFKKAGTYKFAIAETAGSDPLISYDAHVLNAIVTVTDSGNGNLTADVSYEGSREFVNKYNPDSAAAVLKGKKVLNGRDLAAGEFTFAIEAVTSGAPMPAVTEVTNDADGNIVFGAIGYKKAGTYEYLIKEKASGLPGVTYDTAPVKATVTVKYDAVKGAYSTSVAYDKAGKSEFVFENTYKVTPVSISIDGVKTVAATEGNSFTMKDGMFQFEIEPADFNPADDPIKEQFVTHDKDGNISIDAEYTAAGTYVYTLHEASGEHGGMIFDDAVYHIEVVVKEEVNTGKLAADVNVLKDGKAVDKITFNNEYDPQKTSAEIHGHKHLEGKELKGGDFSFAIKALTEGAPMPAETTVKNADTGIFQFGIIVYESVGTYEYEISEVNEGKSGYSYDSSVYKVKVTVTDEDGKLNAHVDGVYTDKHEPVIVFNNEYKPAPVKVAVKAAKVLEGRDLTAGEFKFVLEDESGNKLYAENAADGTINFEAINYDAAGTYKYKLYEEAGDEKFVTYDETVYDITVSVKDDLDGNLKATVEGVNDGIVFKNVYEPKEPHLNIEKLQSVNGGNPTKDVLVVEEGDIITYYVKVWNDGEWTAEDVVIKDAVPEGLELIENSLAAEGGVLGEDGVTISWTIGDLEVGEEAVVTFQVEAPLADKDQLDEDGYQHWYNIASVSYSNNPDNPGEPDDPSDPDEPDKDIPSNEVEVKEPVPEEPPTDPTEPTEPTEPEVPMDDTSDGGTQTGDDFNTGLYGFLALAALAVAGAAVGRRRKTE